MRLDQRAVDRVLGRVAEQRVDVGVVSVRLRLLTAEHRALTESRLPPDSVPMFLMGLDALVLARSPCRSTGSTRCAAAARKGQLVLAKVDTELDASGIETLRRR